jgi:hypothetical protein
VNSRDVQKALDSWFPTFVRYAGLGLIVYAAVLNHELASNPAFWPAVGGMVLFKFVIGDGKRE